MRLGQVDSWGTKCSCSAFGGGEGWGASRSRGKEPPRGSGVLQAELVLRLPPREMRGSTSDCSLSLRSCFLPRDLVPKLQMNTSPFHPLSSS